MSAHPDPVLKNGGDWDAGHELLNRKIQTAPNGALIGRVTTTENPEDTEAGKTPEIRNPISAYFESSEVPPKGWTGAEVVSGD
jgi:hypothetical protein